MSLTFVLLVLRKGSLDCRHSQLLQGDRLLLVLIDRNTNLHLHLDRLNDIENSIGRGHGKILHRNKIGDEILLAFDESQAMLALISCDKVRNMRDPNVKLELMVP